MAKGKLYGVSVGPGDPELITIKAAKIIMAANVIAFAGGSAESCTAYKIAVKAIPDIEKKPSLALALPMTKDMAALKKSRSSAATSIAGCLDKGQDVAYLTLGDVSIYSTYTYLQDILRASGYDTEMISGVPSFCAAAARLGTAIASADEQIHIIPAVYGPSDGITYPGTRIYMKSAGRLAEVRQALMQTGDNVYMAENCGMEGERLFYSAEEIDDGAGYYSVMIVREK